MTLTRRTWTVHEEEVLINGLRSLVASGWKCDNGFRIGYLAQLENFMLCPIPNYDHRAKPHITSKIQAWKRQYFSIVGMMSKSGFGWDESQCMVTIEENDKDVWDDYVKREIFVKDCAAGDVANDTDGAASEICHEKNNRIDNYYIPTAEWNPKMGFMVLKRNHQYPPT
ncbi:hypothetical protein Sango_2861900 [Sesamum angolense]|uniref:Myb/SANT-like domain-containing protein n=1 Tax=Sesamum angolense TaxID=2727404 RepID=A0AAE1T6V0_9LAMI|nr:hypothetical protein Sango_2861900 [Sesamum angolense]